MTAHIHERVEELLALHAVEGLGTQELAELRSLGVSDDEIESMELAAAAAAVALLDAPEAMPASLRERVLAQAPVVAAPALKLAGTERAGGQSAQPRSSGGVLPWAGWLAAAAAILLAALAWWPGTTQPGAGPAPAPSLAAQRQALLARADAVRSTWADWGETPSVAGVEGDVVWSHALQEGYMRFRGLAPNNPGEAQYQLWIVDGARGVPLQVPPVDGGVFDVTDAGEVIVPIRAALPVGQAVAFAITVEPPGGVVVSEQNRKVVVAFVQQ
jgi:hypothetical protein